MARTPRRTPAEYVYHVISRGFLRAEIFADAEDYQTFIDLLTRHQKRYDMRSAASPEPAE